MNSLEHYGLNLYFFIINDPRLRMAYLDRTEFQKQSSFLLIRNILKIFSDSLHERLVNPL